MREGADMAQAGLAALRHRIAAIEGRPGWSAAADPVIRPVGRNEGGDRQSVPLADEPPASAGRLSLGPAALDRPLGGGLLLAALHEVHAETALSAGAATGFVAALLALLVRRDRRPVLWVEEETALAEAGFPFGPGLAGFGLDPGRLILVRARKLKEALWAMEEGLSCRGLAAAAAVVRRPLREGLTRTRRLALRARDHGVTGLLFSLGSGGEPSAATTRWRIVPQPAAVTDGFAAGIGRPAFRAVLDKNRLGRTGSFDLEWDHEHACLVLSGAADAGLDAAVPGDRPDHPGATGAALAERRAG